MLHQFLVMVTENDISSCCFSPNKATLVFAGLLDGTICVWDHREDLSDHREVFVRCQFEQFNEQTFLSPTYITHNQDEETYHMSKVTSMRSLENRDSNIETDGGYGNAASETQVSSSSSSTNNLFQLASIEENGCLIIWTVLDGQENVELHTGYKY
jgi:WD40 repeat protein